ncbi:IS66 family transposase, partial [Corallococcus sp. AB011P]|uniref:IS66 family transposase n=1 Tax=Corallococcus sp. AB011P TaxID=2316735 RepID=UPI002106CA63
MESQAPRHLPKGPMGQALSYALKQWDALTRFSSDARLPVSVHGVVLAWGGSEAANGGPHHTRRGLGVIRNTGTWPRPTREMRVSR